MRLRGAFTALLLLVFTVSAVTAAVQNPTNVNLSCQNLKTTVTWDYSDDQPQTSFRVSVISFAGDHEFETTDHQYDLSPFIWSSPEHYTAFHYVNVTAVQGGRESTPVTSKTLSFGRAVLADIKCDLDFPPAGLTAGDSGFTVSFHNPFFFYEELEQSTKPDNVYFEFKVSSDSGEDLGSADCRLTQKMCRYDFSTFPKDVEECVKLSGCLDDGNHVNFVRFRETDRICVSGSAEIHTVTLTTLLCVFTLIIIAVAVAIYQARAWMSKPDSQLISLDFDKDLTQNLCIHPSPERTDYVTVEGRQRCSSCSSEEEESGSTEEEDQSSSAGSDQYTNYTPGALLENSGQQLDPAQDPAQDPAHEACRGDYEERPHFD